MNFYERSNFLIIHGGRNDLVSDSFALNDTFVFDLFYHNWIRIEIYSQSDNFRITTRCCHSSMIFSKKIPILFTLPYI